MSSVDSGIAYHLPFLAGISDRRIPQVCGCPLKQIWVIFEESQADVATRTDDPPRLTIRMPVVHTKRLERWRIAAEHAPPGRLLLPGSELGFADLVRPQRLSADVVTPVLVT